MQPFDSYPGGGRVLLGEPRDWTNSRHGYGLDLQQVTRQTCCAYCGLSLVDTYEHWLLLSVDHVVPGGQALALGIPRHFSQDMLNLVLCCAGCNGFGNRYTVPVVLGTPSEEWDLSAFLVLRDAVFDARCHAIAARRATEVAAFEQRRWTHPARPRLGAATLVPPAARLSLPNDRPPPG